MYIVLCQGENKNIIILDQITTYVFVSKGIQVAYVNLNLS